MKKFNLMPFSVLLIASAIGASSGLYIKNIGLSSLALSGFRMGVPFLALLPFVIKRGSWRGPIESRKTIWLASILNTIRMVLYVIAFKLTTIGNAVVLLYLWPVFAMLINGILKHQKPILKEIVILSGAFTGVVIMNLHREFSFSNSDFLGTISMIGSALLFAVTTLIFKSSLKQSSETETLFFQNAIGGVIFLGFLISEIPGATPADLGFGVLYGFSVGLLGFGCYFFALKRLPVFQYSAVAYIEVFFGVFFGIAYLAEELRLNMVIGGVLIIAMSLWAAMPQRKIAA